MIATESFPELTNWLIRLFFILIYATAAIVVYRRLFPSLGVGAKLVAAFMLLAQTLAIAIALGYQPQSEFEAWLWYLDGEFSITPALAATQLALVAWAALAGAWGSHRRWHRLYLRGLSLLFFFLSYDEYFQIHDRIRQWEFFHYWELHYAAVGAVVALVTMFALRRAPSSERKWHICFLIGLALGGAGALGVEWLHEPAVCALFDESAPGGCRWHFYLEEPMEFLGMWLALVATLGHCSASSPSRRQSLVFCALGASATLLFWMIAILPSLGTGSIQYWFAPEEFMESVIWSFDAIYPVVALLFITVGVISLRWLVPRLQGFARGLALLLYAAHAITILLAFATESAAPFDKWLWDMGQEYNIHSLLSSAQLALIGFVALFCAWLARARPTVFRIYMLAIGLIFLFLAYDEYAVIHENIQHWERYYLMLGMAVALATMAVAARVPRRQRLWHACFLVGVAMSAVGIVFHDMPRQICEGQSALPLRGCLLTYNYEEPLELLGIWLALLAMLGMLSDIRPRPGRRVYRALYALPALWIVLLTHGALLPRLQFQFAAVPSAIQIESGVALIGYRLDQSEDKITVDVYSSALQRNYRRLGFSVHLIDQADGGSLAKTDVNTDYQTGWLFAPSQPHIYRQRIEVDIPSSAPRNRAMWIALSAWREVGGEYLMQPVIESDLQRLGKSQVILHELVLPAKATPSQSEPLATFDNGFALQDVNLPESANAGEILPVAFTWRSEVDGQGDYSQFLHLGHEASGEWLVYDQPPLGDRMPTRLWHKGMSDSETWHVPLPVGLAPGQYSVFTGLYRVNEQARLPMTAAGGYAPPDARLQLGSLLIDG